MADNTQPTDAQVAQFEQDARNIDSTTKYPGKDVTTPTEEQVAQYGRDAEAIDATTKSGQGAKRPPTGGIAETVPSSVTGNIPQVQPPTGGLPVGPKQAQLPSPAVVPPTAPVHPSVQRASWLHDVAETLAGGPKYKYNIDVNTGEMKREKVDVSPRMLGLTIALEALSGGLTGLAAGRGRGPGAAGATALAQSEQRSREQDERAQKEASDNYARQASIAQTNMRMAMNERSLADAEEAAHQRDVDTYAPIYAEAQKVGAVERTGVGEDEIHQLMKSGAINATTHIAIPIRVRPAMNADGTQAKGPNGEPKYEKEFAILTPSAQLTIPQETLQTLYKHKVQGFVDGEGNPRPIPEDFQTKLSFIVNATEQARTLNIGQEMFKNYRDTAVKGAATSGPVSATTPTIKDANVAEAIDTTAAKYGLDANIFRAQLLEESGANPKVKDSERGAIGIGQITPSTGQRYGASPDQLRDLNTNLDVAARYMKDLLAKNNGDYEKALRSYHGIGSDGITTDTKYFQDISKAAGIGQGAATAAPKGISDEDLEKVYEGFTSKEWDTLIKAGGPQAFTNGKPGELSTAEKLAEPNAQGVSKLDPQSVGMVRAALNNVYNIEQRKSDVVNQAMAAQVKKSEDINKAKIAEELAQQQKMKEILIPPDNWQFDPSVDILHMDPVSTRKYLESKGVKVMPEIEGLKAAALYKVPLSIAAQKLYKLVPALTAMDVTSYIRTFLDPQFDETKYGAAADFRKALTPEGKIGQNIMQAGIASNHVELAEQALQNLHNRRAPMWNRFANAFQTNIGAPEPTVYKAIADVLTNEVGKVVSGGSQAYQGELEKLHANLTNADSPETALGVLDAYVGLMQGRISEVNDRTEDYFKEQVHVSPNVARIFGKHGFYVPGYGYPIQSNKGGFGFSKTGDPKDMTPFVDKGQ